MKRLFAALLLAAVALSLATACYAAAGQPYAYKWQTVRWTSDSTNTYLPLLNGTILAAQKNSALIPIPEDAFYPSIGDSLPFIILEGDLDHARASTDTLSADIQFTYNGTDYYPAQNWIAGSQVLVGAGQTFTLRISILPGAGIAATDRLLGSSTHPNSVRIVPVLKGALGFRVNIIHTATCHGPTLLRMKAAVMVHPS
jgi:hypothetical protein